VYLTALDKAKVEVAVQLVERWILARLRTRTFFSLAELNSAIWELMKDFNSRPFKKLPGSRLSQFEELEKGALKPLPLTPYEYAEWKKVRAGFDYHVEIDGHYYSVPYSLARKQLDARLQASIVEILYRGKRIASHVRSSRKGAKTTLPAHMPKAHLKYLEWTPARLLEWAASVGPFTTEVILHLFETKPHEEAASRSGQGLVSLARHYGAERLEQACKRAVVIGSLTYQSVANILKTGLDRFEFVQEQETQVRDHENVRGSAYYADLDNELLN
jgi:transposase